MKIAYTNKLALPAFSLVAMRVQCCVVLCCWAARLRILGLRFTRSDLRFIINHKAVFNHQKLDNVEKDTRAELSMSKTGMLLSPKIFRHSEELPTSTFAGWLVEQR